MELEFEKGIPELEEKIKELKKFAEEQQLDLSDQVKKLEEQRDEELKKIYKNLSSWKKYL